MTKTAVAYSRALDSRTAGRELGAHINEELGTTAPGAVIVFASAQHDYTALLEELSATCRPRLMLGASSAGEFAAGERGEGSACAVALSSDGMQFHASLGRALSSDRPGAARAIVAGFKGPSEHAFPYRTALVLTDALAGHTDDLVEELTRLTGGTYQFVGGGAGDDARFSRTHVFFGTEAVTDAVVALEILSKHPVGVGVQHGWIPASDPLRVTEATGTRIASLNGLPAIEAFAAHAERTGQRLDRAEPFGFFLHNILGIRTPDGNYRLRAPLSVGEDGAVHCAAEVPPGSIVHIMGTSASSAAEAAAIATRSALAGLGGERPQVALLFDCVATRLRLGQLFGLELAAVADMLAPAKLAGCNTYGQIARAEGQFGGFHNCTAVVCVLPS